MTEDRLTLSTSYWIRILIHSLSVPAFYFLVQEVGLEPTRTYCPTNFPATLCYHSQNFPYPTHAYVLSATIFVTATFYISGRCCLGFVGFNSMFVLLWSGLSLYHIRNVATKCLVMLLTILSLKNISIFSFKSYISTLFLT